MQRRLLCVLMIALLMTLVSADAASLKKKSRPSRAGSRSQVRGSVKRKAPRGRVAREVSRSKKGRRGKYAVRGKRGGRRLARSRSGNRSYQPQDPVAPGVSRPAPGIPAERVTEIQNALIKVGYMDGPASGQYDDATIDAMKQYQAANALPQTGLPSAIVLKKLGVRKRSNDGYAAPVNSVSETEKKRPPL